MKNKSLLLKIILIIATVFILILSKFSILPFDIVNKIMSILAIIGLLGVLLVEIRSKEKSIFLIVLYSILMVLEASQLM